jgi:hypothetical protein
MRLYWSSGKLALTMDGIVTISSNIMIPTYANKWIKIGVKHGKVIAVVYNTDGSVLYTETLIHTSPCSIRPFSTQIFYGADTSYDEIRLINSELEDSAIISYEIAPNLFDANTVLLAHLDYSLFAGDNYVESSAVSYKILKKKTTDTQFKTVGNVTVSSGVTYMDDYLVENNTEYEYGVYPMDINNNSGNSILTTATQDFFGWILVNESNTIAYKFDLEMDSDNVEIVEDFKIYDNYAIYPYISFGKRNYRKGKLTTMPYSLSGCDIIINVDTLNEIKAFINDKQPKYLKNTAGEMWKVATSGFSYKYMDRIKSQPYNISFNFTQIGE